MESCSHKNNATQFFSLIKQLKLGKRRAVGPDGLTIHQFKQLSPAGLWYLTHLFNLSFNHADIPAIWKTATVILLLKPADQAPATAQFQSFALL